MPAEIFRCPRDYDLTDEDGKRLEPGWYYWFCQPGCLPDSDPNGPFDTQAAAERDIKENEDTDND